MLMEIYQLKNLINEPKCFKSDNPKCLDLILSKKFFTSKFWYDRNRIIGLSIYEINCTKGWPYQKGSQNS